MNATATAPALSYPGRSRLNGHKSTKAQVGQYAYELYLQLHPDATEEDFLRDLEGRLLLAPPTSAVPEQFR